ncbi:MAG: hypothetical protein WBI17_06930 [Clostridiaceae bacterium]
MKDSSPTRYGASRFPNQMETERESIGYPRSLNNHTAGDCAKASIHLRTAIFLTETTVTVRKEKNQVRLNIVILP